MVLVCCDQCIVSKQRWLKRIQYSEAARSKMNLMWNGLQKLTVVEESVGDPRSVVLSCDYTLDPHLKDVEKDIHTKASVFSQILWKNNLMKGETSTYE
jgi:hypothetical protein